MLPWLRLPDWDQRPKSAVGGFVTRQFCIPAAPSQLGQVRRYAEDAASDFGLAANDRFRFVFAVNEAVTNAIRHGSRGKDATVCLEIDADGDALVCSVHDSGPFLVPRGPSDALAENGRGLALIALLMDEFELSTHDGTTVRILKRRRSEASDGEQ